MKYRTAFVSNSSSSSFTCKVCGNNVSGFDMCLRDAEMVECVNGHLFCTDHLIPPIKFKDYIEDENGKYVDKIMTTDNIDDVRDCYDGEYNILPESCPICQLKHIPNSVLLDFILKDCLTATKDELIQQFRNTYGNYTNFCESSKMN